MATVLSAKRSTTHKESVPCRALNYLFEELAKNRSRSSWNDRLTHWEKPASDSEVARIERAASMVRDALSASAWLTTEGVTVAPQGSYYNNTNVRQTAGSGPTGGSSWYPDRMRQRDRPGGCRPMPRDQRHRPDVCRPHPADAIRDRCGLVAQEVRCRSLILPAPRPPACLSFLAAGRRSMSSPAFAIFGSCTVRPGT